tara:strand:- start:977 stop:1981 length:1005 start_codon:yes stop_codon:yes gene_type:complete
MKKITIFISLLILFACEEDKDETPPTVMITNIQAGAKLSDIVKVTVDANDNDAIALVEFFVNGALSGTSESDEAIHNFNWDTDAGDNGSYQIYAKATDESDNIATSAILSVNVINYRTANFFNTTLVPLAYQIDNEGDYKWIESGDTAKIEVPKNTSINFNATTPTNWCGTKLKWNTDIDIPDTHVLWRFWVPNNYFLLYTKNNDKVPVDYTVVNKDLTGYKTCYSDIPNDGVEHILGFYTAHTNSNISWYMKNHPDYDYWHCDGDKCTVNYLVPDGSHTDRNLYAKYHLQTPSEASDRIAVQYYDDGYIGIPSRDESSTALGGIEIVEKETIK